MGFDFAFDADDILPPSVTRHLDFTVDATLEPFPDDDFEQCYNCDRTEDLRPLLITDQETGVIERKGVCASCQRDVVDGKLEQLNREHPPNIEADPENVPEAVAEAAEAIEAGADPDEVMDGLDPAALADPDPNVDSAPDDATD